MPCCRRPLNVSFPKSLTHLQRTPLTLFWLAECGAPDAPRQLQVRQAPDPEAAALHAQHQKAVRQARKAKADACLAEVDTAIQAGDQYVAYKVLKQLRPWQPSQKAQLKDSKEFLLSPSGELEELRKYAADVFGKNPRLRDNFVGLPPLDPPC